MIHVLDDGGREAAGFKGSTRDCVTRAIAIATETDYREVYDALTERARVAALTARKKKHGSPRSGVYRSVYQPYLEGLGWAWTPTMQIGSGCTVHLCAEELPAGRLIASVSRHLVAVVDGVARDTHDPTRDGRRCVYGYYSPGAKP